MSTSRMRLLAALIFVLPISAMVVAPAAYAASSKAKHHNSSVHKASHKTSHKSSHKKDTTPAG